MKLHQYIGALFVLGFSLVARAEDAEIFNVSFSSYPLGDRYSEQLFYQNAAGSEKPVIILKNKGMRSPVHDYTGPSPLRFYRVVEAEDGTRQKVEVAAVDLEQSVDNYLLFFAHSKSQAEKVFVKKMDDDWSSFPTKHLKLFNASHNTIYIGFGGERITLKPGQVSAPYLIPDSTHDSIPVGIVKRDTAGNLDPIMQNRWRFYGEGRELIILTSHFDESSDELAVYRVSQYGNI
jgi:hypothetical protein